jgi:hypothetical protein
MASERIADMTLDELKEWVNQQVDLRVQQLLTPATTRTIKEINDTIRRHRWTPPPGSPTNLELLREDRDR